MRILILNDHGHVVGGAAAVALNAALGLAAAGHTVLFLCAVGPVDPRLAAAGVEVIDLGRHDLLGNPSRLQAAANGLWDRSVAAALAAVLARLDPADTVVHLHTWVKSLSVSVVPVVKRLGFPLVVTLHDYFSVCPNGGLYDYPAQAICHRQPLSLVCITRHCDARSYPHKLWRVVRQGVQQGPGGLPRLVDAWISVSALSEQILRPYLPAAARLFRVPNPIDVPRLPVPGEAGGPTDAALGTAPFLFLGRLAPEKGGAVLAQAAAREGLPVTYVGEGEARAEWQRLHPAGLFTGWLDRAATLQQLQGARALVFPSQWYETQGLVVSEAAALGIPAIVSDCTAAAENIVDGETGWLFAAGDVAALARKMRWMIDHPREAAAMGAAAYVRYWSAPCDLARHVAGLEDVYQALLPPFSAVGVASTHAL